MLCNFLPLLVPVIKTFFLSIITISLPTFCWFNLVPENINFLSFFLDHGSLKKVGNRFKLLFEGAHPQDKDERPSACH